MVWYILVEGISFPVENPSWGNLGLVLKVIRKVLFHPIPEKKI
jgi:hypothetical protein